MNIERLKVPSKRATEYHLKDDKELSQYWEQLNRDCYGEIIIDSDTLDHIGHVFVWHTKRDKGFIFNLEVKPRYRRQGIGWILLDDAVKKYDGIDLLVDEDNIPAIKLYEKYGFETIKTVNGQLWMKLNQIKQEGVIMFFDRLGNAITGEQPIIEEPVVESYYDPNRPVRPGFEKPEMFQEGLFESEFNNEDIEEYTGEDIKEYSEMDLDEMSDYIQENVITEAAEDVNRNQFRKYVKKLMFDKNWNTYGSDKSEGSCFLYLFKKRLKPEFIKYFDRIHEILTQYKESSTPMPTSVKHELFGLLGLSDTKWDIYPNRSSIYSDYIELAIYKSTDTKNIFDKTGYRFFHQSNVPTINQTGLKPSLGSTHGRVVNGENTYNRVYNKPSCFFLAIRSTDVESFYDYIVKYQQEGKYGKYIYEYKPKSSDVFYEDLFNRKGHQKFGRIMAVPVFINTDKNLPVTRVDKNIATLGAKQRRDDLFVRHDIERDKIEDKHKNGKDMRDMIHDYRRNKRELEYNKREIEDQPDIWFRRNGYATPWELSKLEEARMFKDDKLYSKIRKRMEAKAYKDKLENFKQQQLQAYRNVKAKNNDRLAKYDKQQKDDEALLKRYKAFESFIDNEISKVDIFLEQSMIDNDEDYDVYLEANEDSKKARKNAQEFMRKEYGTSHPTSMTSKQRNRMKKWLKDNDYDPKTKTIKTDIIDKKTGKPFRVNIGTNMTSGDEGIPMPFAITPERAHQAVQDAKQYGDEDDKVFARTLQQLTHDGRSYINMPKSYMKRHPSISTGVSKHEEGHVADLQYKRQMAGENLANTATKYGTKHGLAEDPHSNPSEYKADIYSVTHNKYKDKLRYLNAITSKDINIRRNLKKTLEASIRDIERDYENPEDPDDIIESKDEIVKLANDTIDNATELVKAFEEMIANGHQYADNIKRELSKYKKEILEEKAFLKKIENLSFAESKEALKQHDIAELVSNYKKMIAQSNEISDTEVKLRKLVVKTFLKEFAIEYNMSTVDVIQEMYQTAFEDYVFQEDFEDEEPFDYDVFIEAKIDAAERNELDDEDFGLVYEDEDGEKIRKYPLTDKIHVRKAVQFFDDCPDDYKPLLAHNILERADEFDMDTSNWDKINKANEKYSDDED